MTQVSCRGAAEQRAILSRFVVLLALVLFGVPQSHAAGTLAHAGHVAQSQLEQPQGILTMQGHMLRPQLPDDHASAMGATGDTAEDRQPLVAPTMSPVQRLSLLPTKIGILPSVRAPPAA